jgi:hypothetical protein
LLRLKKESVGDGDVMVWGTKSGIVLVIVESKPDAYGCNIPIELTYKDENFEIKIQSGV